METEVTTISWHNIEITFGEKEFVHTNPPAIEEFINALPKPPTKFRGVVLRFTNKRNTFRTHFGIQAWAIALAVEQYKDYKFVAVSRKGETPYPNGVIVHTNAPDTFEIGCHVSI